MRQVRLTSWQPFPYDQRHPFLGASRSHRITKEQDTLVRESRPALYDASGRNMEHVAAIVDPLTERRKAFAIEFKEAA